MFHYVLWALINKGKKERKIEFDIITTRQSGRRQYTTRHKPKCTYCSYSYIDIIAVAAATTTTALCVLWERDLTWTARKARIMHANYNHGRSDANLWMLVLCFMASFVVGSIFSLSALSLSLLNTFCVGSIGRILTPVDIWIMMSSYAIPVSSKNNTTKDLWFRDLYSVYIYIRYQCSFCSKRTSCAVLSEYRGNDI